MVYVFLAEGFEDVEAIAPIDILRRAGLDVVTVGVTGKTVNTSHGIPVIADITVDQIKLNDELQMIVLPGGMPGTTNLENSSEVQAAIDYCFESKKYIAAICAAPTILGHKGLLTGIKATCFPGCENALKGSAYMPKLVIHDGIFITGKGPGAAFKFGFKLAELLCGKEKSLAVETNMQCRE
ncbi:MAG: DJ-1/PfpI family protein [Ruminococcus sp.]|nr:DJ-1/PfpI family protein [Ruminococcus sp.]